jgi:hypothetical protein
VKLIYTITPCPNYAPVLVGKTELAVLEEPPLVALAVPATVACTIWPSELKMMLTNALSGAYKYCFCTCPPASPVSTPV